ncbi:NADPH-cytochrome P450 reductase [Fusarium beomiforme]|uniref:NADPH--cytochrome P450 reductase n=1 Tax=Fusarium beomiforme TaxID=44412 RepID=A0A9P5DTN9_9HYPO|nr:NADPH-cytochrome P450 reductase [Fusarium beomiforme]
MAISISMMFFFAVVGEILAHLLRNKTLVSTIWKHIRWSSEGTSSESLQASTSRCIVTQMKQNDKNCVVFFGSQSGNAQDLAAKIAKEGHARFGLKTMVADLDDFDYDRLNEFPHDAVAIFVMASYGDGEPTDNAQAFFDAATAQDFLGDSERSTALSSLRYASLGLGNSSYAHYNAVIREVNHVFQEMGATRLGPGGEIDDADNNLEEDFLAWKEDMWAAVSESLGVEEIETLYEPSYVISETSMSGSAPGVQQTAQDLAQYNVAAHGTFQASRVTVANCHNLFADSDRVCLHVELSLTGTGLSYHTGDHLGVLPANSNQEVDRFLRVFGLEQKRDVTIEIHAVDMTSQLLMPSSITYEAAVRYYMDICGPVSRQTILALSSLVTNEKKSTLLALGQNKDSFNDMTHQMYFNLASFVETVFPDDPVLEVPFSALIENMPQLRPRFYSISSSSVVQRDIISITAVVESLHVPNTSRYFKGVATNYLFNAATESNPDGFTSGLGRLSYPPEIPTEIPVFVRTSTFRLPQTDRPALMIGAGTGVAPFRGFLQEKCHEVQGGQPSGPITLLYGCRKDPGDFLYKEEWERCKAVLGDKFTMHTALSRQTETKRYVQDVILEELVDKVHQLIQGDGYIYVCGDAKMGREVSSAISKAFASKASISPEEADQHIEAMRRSRHYQEDVW